MATQYQVYHTDCIASVLNERAKQKPAERKSTLMTTARAKDSQTCDYCSKPIPVGEYCVQVSAWDSPFRVG